MKNHFLSALIGSGLVNTDGLFKTNPFLEANLMELKEEYNKIKTKKSNFSRKEREQIIQAYEHRTK